MLFCVFKILNSIESYTDHNCDRKKGEVQVTLPVLNYHHILL